MPMSSDLNPGSRRNDGADHSLDGVHERAQNLQTVRSRSAGEFPVFPSWVSICQQPKKRFLTNWLSSTSTSGTPPERAHWLRCCTAADQALPCC